MSRSLPLTATLTTTPTGPAEQPQCGRCGCDRDAHEHNRVGSDCGWCGPLDCPRYRRPGGPVALTVRVGRAGLWLLLWLVDKLSPPTRLPLARPVAPPAVAEQHEPLSESVLPERPATGLGWLHQP